MLSEGRKRETVEEEKEREKGGGERETDRQKETTHAMGVYVTRALVTVTSQRRDAMQRLHTVDSAVNYCIIRSRPHRSMNCVHSILFQS